MRDLFTIIIAERRTLLRGLIVSFLLVFPFTFLPIISDGLTWENIRRRFPMSAIYAFGFSLFVVIAAVFHNYNNLVDRKKHFDKPAFTNLDFHGRLDGLGSIVSELETFLLGKVGKYYFRLNLIDPEQKAIRIEIVPLIDLKGKKEMKAKLRKELNFKQNLFFGLTVKVKESDLQNENFMLDKLSWLEAKLNEFGAIPLEIDEDALQEQ